MRFRGALFVPLLATACATTFPLGRAEAPRATALRPSAARTARDPTVRDVRFVPIARAKDERTYGFDPGGGVRSIEDGVRVVSFPGGVVLTADDRLPVGTDTPTVTALPERLGGGFLFLVDDTHVWRAAGWLEPARLFFTSRTALGRLLGGRVTGGLVAGLDRVYAQTRVGSWQALDGASGKEMPLGPWPASPTVGAYAALDGWRAIAIGDLRGAVATFDAGATWRSLRLPADARDVIASGDAFDLRALDPGGLEVHFEVRADGQITRTSDARAASPVAAIDPVASREPSGPLGASPLAAAVEDGWPAGDGTAIVARDGALARVRLDDGGIDDLALGAYPLRPSRCHAIALGPPGNVGFVCGEPRGASALYAFDPSRGRMDEVRRFDSPRAILAAGNGAVAVRGPCDPHAAGDASADAHHYCIGARDGSWREIRLEGSVGGERLVVLGDGRVAIVSPPLGALGGARVTLLDGAHAKSVPVAFPKMSVDVQRVVDVGVWLDGFEERRPGVVGGWIEAAGAMLGVEIALTGDARFGELVREAGAPMVSGRYGLGWTRSRIGYETTNGGMTWSLLDVPAPIAPTRAIASRACGPVGCAAGGWLRIGWGLPNPEAPDPPRARPFVPRAPVSLSLACDAVADRARSKDADPLAVLPPPKTTSDETSLVYDSAFARVYAWGPKSAGGAGAGAGEWDRVAKWSVRWAWPFGGASDARASIVSPAPALLAAAARVGAASLPIRWTTFTGDDASHALLLAHRRRDETSVFELEADRAPMEIERTDGEPFGEIDSAIRAGGRWYFATPPHAGERMEAVVWEVDGPVARELARVPRWSDKPSPHARLAWRADGRAIGLVVDGAPTIDRAWPTRWVVAIDLETGALGDVEPLGAQDFGDRGPIVACGRDDDGWIADLPASLPITIAVLNGVQTARSPLARVHLSASRVCVEKLAASVDALAAFAGGARAPAPSASPTAASPPASLSVAVTGSGGPERRPLRCRVR